MTMIVINNRSYEAPEEVVELLRLIREEKDFYKKVLCMIYMDRIQGNLCGLDHEVVRHMCKEAVNMYR